MVVKCDNLFIDVAVSFWVLGTDGVIRLLCVGRVQDESRPVHQVEQVAVVRPVVQDGEGLGPGVGLQQHK